MPLKNAPGKTYSYSNLGFCILGRVIEKITKKEFSTYVKECMSEHDIDSFEIATNKRSKGGMEVTYYSQEKSSPYDMPISRMDSHGGWIATSKDLVKLLLRVDGKSKPKDFLSGNTVRVMTRPSENNPNYALGWSVNKNNNWWHNGSLPGTASIMVRTNNDMCWAVLVNTRVLGNQFLSDLDSLTWNIVRKVY